MGDTTGGRRRRGGAALTVVALVAGLMAASATTAAAPTVAAAADNDDYVALGDSYVAGPLIPNQTGQPLGCLRSDRNYPRLVAQALGLSLTDVSCSGAETDDMANAQGVTPGPNPPQFNSLSADTDIVTVGIGGNDIGFSSIVTDCIAFLPISAAVCQPEYVQNGVDQISNRIATTAPKVAAVIQGIRSRAPHARIYVVGYPAILPESGGGCWPSLPLSNADLPWLRAKNRELNQMLAAQAALNDAHYVDLYTPGIDHDACQAVGVRWVEGIVPHLLQAAPVHPNATGMAGMASVVQGRIAATPDLPTAPVNLAATPGDAQVALEWGPPEDDGGGALTAYQVLRDGVLVHTTPNSSTRTFTDTGLTNGTTYGYAVAAMNASGVGAPSPIVSARPSAAPGTTGISGTVTETGSGAPVAGAMVAVLRSSDHALVGGGVADASGNYSAQVLAGTYHLFVVAPASGHESGFHGPPTPVTVTNGSMADVDPSMSPSRGSIAGTVSRSGTADPVPGAWAIAISPTSGSVEQGATADGSGRYILSGLPDGGHWVVYVDPSGAHRPEFFPDAPSAPASTPVPVTAGRASTADVSLASQTVVGTGASLTGTVTSSGNGAPLAGARVVALRASDFSLARGAVTNASGAYSLDLVAGGYWLGFLDPSGLHAMEWYDGQPNAGLGSATMVTAPAVADAQLDPRTGSIGGAVIDDVSLAAVSGAWVVAIDSSGQIAGGTTTAANGTYTITGLVAGTYRVTYVDPLGGRRQEYYEDASSFAAATPVAVSGGGSATASAAMHHP